MGRLIWDPYISSLGADVALGSIDAVIFCSLVCATEIENIVMHFHLLSITLKGII